LNKSPKPVIYLGKPRKISGIVPISLTLKKNQSSNRLSTYVKTGEIE
jgi:hypothetical protein